ncbi:MAG: metal ABC transporter permease [Actinobacteria bacterium]|nr:MAG: metal ABC transporter permease [Actinomycetota bacterium]
MRNAFLAGTGIAACCGAVGYFVVLRSQVFTGDALSHVAFTGALAALAAGADLRFSIYTSSGSGANGTAGVSVLFGSILGLSAGAARAAALIGATILGGVLLIARPLLFASLDEAVAAARGVPVRALGVGFLALVGVTAAETTQAVGALLLLGLLAAPAAAAHHLTTHPFRGLALSTALAIGAMWVGLAASYAFPSVPPSFAIIATAAVTFAGASAVHGAAKRGLLRGSRKAEPPAEVREEIRG